MCETKRVAWRPEVPGHSQRVWDPQKPKIDPVDPPVDPILAHFVCKKADFGVKKTRFSQKSFFAPNHFLSVPRWPGTLKNPKLALYTPQRTPFGPILWAFWANLGSKNAFFSKEISSTSYFFGSQMVWDPQIPTFGPVNPPMDPFGRAPAPLSAMQPAWSRT